MKKEVDRGIDPGMDTIDIMCCLLKERKKQIHYKDLICEALEIREEPAEREEFQRKAAALLTQMNLDVRFHHYGQGIWGLKEWSPKEKPPKVPLLKPLHKEQREPLSIDDEEEEDVEEDIKESFIIDEVEFDDDEEEEY